MTYRFRSKATGDLVLLDRDGRRLLEIIGKEPGPRGIILPGQAAAAVAALERAVAGDEAQQPAPSDASPASDEGGSASDDVSLRHRARPFIDMLRRSGDEGVEIVWDS